MRLYSTLSRQLEELPPPPGPVRMYFCGPTVYQRAHIGNARPFVVGMWLRAWLRARGYDATLVHNITDVNDKIYDAAPGASAELAARATEWYLEDTGDLGLGMPDELPKATECIPGIVHFIEQLVDSGHAYAVEGDVYFSVASDPEYGRLSGQRPDQVEEQEPNPLKRDPRDFALWKANKPGEDTAWESPWGYGRPGWHIECSAMAEAAFGPVFEIHGGGLDLVFPHHENELAQSRALGHEFAKLWMHNGMLAFSGEKMSKSLGNDVSLRNVLDTWGREAVLMFFLSAHWRKPVDFTDETLAQAKAQVETFRNFFLDGEEGEEDGEAILVNELAAVLDDDFNTPEALALFHDWRAREEAASLRWGLGLFGLGSVADAAAAPPEVVALAEQRIEARGAQGLRRGGPAPRRDRRGRLGGPRHRRAAGLPARPALVNREQVYGRRPVREALRGRREVLELWATERAVKSEAWLREAEKPRVQVKLDRDLSDAAGTRDHQGVLAWCEPYRYADAYELAAGERPLLACLDQVSDPRNLGAVCRSAEGAGATGVVVPAHGSARVTPAVCRASAGAVEHLPVAVVTNLARYLAEIKGDDLWIAAAAGESGTPMWQADLSGGLAFVFGAEGKGLRPLVRRTCDLAVSIPQLGRVESLNVSVAAAVLLYEARRQRDG